MEEAAEKLVSHLEELRQDQDRLTKLRREKNLNPDEIATTVFPALIATVENVVEFSEQLMEWADGVEDDLAGSSSNLQPPDARLIGSVVAFSVSLLRQTIETLPEEQRAELAPRLQEAEQALARIDEIRVEDEDEQGSPEEEDQTEAQDSE